MNIKELQMKNWINIIKEKSLRIMEEHKDDIDFMTKLINGDFEMLAQEEFCYEKSNGFYDKMNVLIPDYER